MQKLSQIFKKKYCQLQKKTLEFFDYEFFKRDLALVGHPLPLLQLQLPTPKLVSAKSNIQFASSRFLILSWVGSDSDINQIHTKCFGSCDIMKI